MKIKIDDYAFNRPLVKNLLNRKGMDSYKDIASEFAVTSGCPIFVVYYFIGEIIGYNEWIVDRMQKIAKFYNYSSIESKQDQGFSVEFDKNLLLGHNGVKKEVEKPKRQRRKKDDT